MSPSPCCCVPEGRRRIAADVTCLFLSPVLSPSSRPKLTVGLRREAYEGVSIEAAPHVKTSGRGVCGAHRVAVCARVKAACAAGGFPGLAPGPPVVYV